MWRLSLPCYWPAWTAAVTRGSICSSLATCFTTWWGASSAAPHSTWRPHGAEDLTTSRAAGAFPPTSSRTIAVRGASLRPPAHEEWGPGRRWVGVRQVLPTPESHSLYQSEEYHTALQFIRTKGTPEEAWCEVLSNLQWPSPSYRLWRSTMRGEGVGRGPSTP
jgi:hypothetical protein